MGKKDKKKRRFGRSNMDTVNAHSGETESGRYMQLKEGRNLIRICPPHSDDAGSFAVKAASHWKLGEENNINTPCLGAPDCPICLAVKKAYKDNPDDKLVKDMKVSTRWKVYAFDADSKAPSVKELDFSPGIYNDILAEVQEAGEDVVSDEFEGQVVDIRRKGSGSGTRYTVKGLKDEFPLSDEVIAQLEEKTPLTELVEPLSIEEAIQLVEKTPQLSDYAEEVEKEMDKADTEDDDDGKKSKKSKKKSKDDDDDDDDEKESKKSKKKSEDDDDDDDDDEDKKSKKSKDDDDDDDDDDKKSSKKSKDDDDDDDDDDEEAERRKRIEAKKQKLRDKKKKKNK